MDIDKLIEETQKIKQLQTQLESLVAKHTEIIIIGNGGSNAISSHISQDYTKELDKKAICFSDPSRLNCYINDFELYNLLR